MDGEQKGEMILRETLGVQISEEKWTIRDAYLRANENGQGSFIDCRRE